MKLLALVLAVFLTTVCAQAAPTTRHFVFLPQVGAACVEPVSYRMNTLSFTLVEPGYWFRVRPNPCGGSVRTRSHYTETVHCPDGCWTPWVSVADITGGSNAFPVRVIQSWPGTTRVYDEVQFVDWSGWSFGVQALLLANP